MMIVSHVRVWTQDLPHTFTFTVNYSWHIHTHFKMCVRPENCCHITRFIVYIRARKQCWFSNWWCRLMMFDVSLRQNRLPFGGHITATFRLLLPSAECACFDSCWSCTEPSHEARNRPTSKVVYTFPRAMPQPPLIQIRIFSGHLKSFNVRRSTL